MQKNKKCYNSDMVHHYKKFGFTLAEVLITLGIIGVVAAVTMPVLIQDHREKVTVTRVKKVYSVLSQALLSAINEYGTPDLWGSYQYDDEEESENTVTRFTPVNLVKQMKVAKECGFKSEGCFPSDVYKSLKGNKERDFENLNNRYYKVVLADGTLLALEGYGLGADNGDKNYGEIWVDINGKSGPNTVGKDLFIFLYKKEKIVPYGYEQTGKPLSSTDCRTTSSGLHCTAWVLYNGNTDYLHCDDLSWSGKTTCK